MVIRVLAKCHNFYGTTVFQSGLSINVRCTQKQFTMYHVRQVYFKMGDRAPGQASASWRGGGVR